MKKYSKFLTLLLIILAISLVVLVVYSIYTLYNDYIADKSAGDLMEQFENNYESNSDQEEPEGNVSPEEGENEIDVGNENANDNSPTQTQSQGKTSSGGSSSYSVGTTYQGYKVIGIISIPKLKIQYPIFKNDNSTTLKVGTAAIYPGPDTVEEALNKPGNVVIAGHNYRNSRMFSKIHTLQEGDSIYITNISGVQLQYKVYYNYTILQEDFNYATRNTNGYPEISLTTCTNDASTRTIVWARAENY